MIEICEKKKELKFVAFKLLNLVVTESCNHADKRR